jgi:hypothetical protein
VLRLRHGRGLGLRFFAQHPERRQVVFDLLERGQHNLTVVRDRGLVARLRGLQLLAPQAPIEERTDDRRPTAQKRLGRVSRLPKL